MSQSRQHPYSGMPIDRKIAALRTIPKSLRSLRQWLLFTLEPRGHDDKWDKRPYYITDEPRWGTSGAEHDLASLATFDDAIAKLQRDPLTYAGIGFAVLEQGKIGCIDFDGIESIERHRALIGQTWSEGSVSGKGVHSFFISDSSGGMVNVRAPGVDIFATNGFIAMTGLPCPGVQGSLTVAPVSADVRTLISALRSDRAPKATSTSAPVSIARPWTAQLQKEVVEALKGIDPDCGYDDWLRVGMALHSADSNIGGPAFATWMKWSKDGGKFRGHKDLENHWRSFERGGGVTISTIFGMSIPKKNLKGKTDLDSVFGDDSADDDPTLETITFGDVTPKNVTWLWEGRIPENCITLIAGEGGVGKGNVACAIISAVVGGRQLPGTGHSVGDEFTKLVEDDGNGEPLVIDPRPVLWLSAEDDIETALSPRLIAAGANLKDPIYFEAGVLDDDGVRALSIIDDIDLIRNYIAEKGVRVVVIDPITAYLSSNRGRRDIDPHNAVQLRSVLAPLSKLARDMEVTIVGVTHFGKDTTRSLVHRISGSATWSQLARSVLIAMGVPDGSGEKVLLPVKSNSGRMAVALKYEIVEAKFEQRGEVFTTSRCEWRGLDPDITEFTLVGTSDRGPTSDVPRIELWMRRVIPTDGMALDELRSLAIEEGFSVGKNCAFDRARRRVAKLGTRGGRQWVSVEAE